MLSTIALLLATSLLSKGSQVSACIDSGVTLQAGPTANVGYATYLGNRSYPDTVAYLGIPYAEPPVGDLRFRKPLPLNTTRVSKQTGGQVVNATYYPEFCIQGSTEPGDLGGSGTEDCLKLNIYAPYGAKEGDNLPIFFYIHGGDFIYGNPRNWPFDSWIHQSPNVVIVSVYYRLGSLGWLAIPEFADPTYGDFNVGFLDQLQALRWVNQYISAFGGDPNQVTISGQSSGGSLIELHMIANQKPQLFHRAIAQSVYRAAMPTPEEQQPLFNFYTSHVGCNTSLVSEQMACLRNASVSTLAAAQYAASQANFGPYNSFFPALDGVVFTGYPTLQFQNGQFAHVPLIIGATSNDTVSFSFSDGAVSFAVNISSELKETFPALTGSDIQEFLTTYPESEFGSSILRDQTATGEPEITCARQAMGGPASLFSNTWTYRYNTPAPGSPLPGAIHSSDNWMMFNGITTGANGTGMFHPQTPAELAFASELVAYWLSFARSGNPNTYKLDMSPTWQPYTSQNKARIVLMQNLENLTTVSGSYMEEQPTAERDRCAFVISKAPHMQN